MRERERDRENKGRTPERGREAREGQGQAEHGSHRERRPSVHVRLAPSQALSIRQSMWCKILTYLGQFQVHVEAHSSGGPLQSIQLPAAAPFPSPPPPRLPFPDGNFCLKEKKRKKPPP